MPLVGFESTIPAFERTKTVLALSRVSIARGCRARQCSLLCLAKSMHVASDRAATVIGWNVNIYLFIYLSIHPSIHLWLYSPLLGLSRFFSFLILYVVGRTPWTGNQPVARPLSTHRTIQTQNKRTQTSVLWVGFKPMIPVFEQAKEVHDLYRADTVIGRTLIYSV
jgi:hypothetical protein